MKKLFARKPQNPLASVQRAIVVTCSRTAPVAGDRAVRDARTAERRLRDFGTEKRQRMAGKSSVHGRKWPRGASGRRPVRSCRGRSTPPRTPVRPKQIRRRARAARLLRPPRQRHHEPCTAGRRARANDLSAAGAFSETNRYDTVPFARSSCWRQYSLHPDPTPPRRPSRFRNRLHCEAVGKPMTCPSFPALRKRNFAACRLGAAFGRERRETSANRSRRLARAALTPYSVERFLGRGNRRSSCGDSNR